MSDDVNDLGHEDGKYQDGDKHEEIYQNAAQHYHRDAYLVEQAARREIVAAVAQVSNSSVLLLTRRVAERKSFTLWFTASLIHDRTEAGADESASRYR